jgi:hypothetical protein
MDLTSNILLVITALTSALFFFGVGLIVSFVLLNKTGICRS